MKNAESFVNLAKPAKIVLRARIRPTGMAQRMRMLEIMRSGLTAEARCTIDIESRLAIEVTIVEGKD